MVGRIKKELSLKGQHATLGTVHAWISKNSSPDGSNRFSFDPPIPDCEEIFLNDSGRLVFVDSKARAHGLEPRTLEGYILKENNLTQT